jgi:hypothetical protein
MLEQLKYKNHINEVFEFGRYGVYVNMNDLHDYEWSSVSKGSKISAFKRGVSTRKLPVVIKCDSEEDGIRARNKLLEICEKDVLALQHGQIIIGDYYFKCFVTRSQKTDYITDKRYMSANLTLTSDYPYWVKESVKTFGTSATASEGLDYPFDFNFDYFTDVSKTVLTNPSFVSSNFKMIVYGACSNPSLIIGGHTYQVNCTVGDGEYLTIDSTTKKIFLTKNDGTTINQFNNRNKTSYIFEKIPSGDSVVIWTGDFGFDVILMEERSEPKWT